MGGPQASRQKKNRTGGPQASRPLKTSEKLRNPGPSRAGTCRAGQPHRSGARWLGVFLGVLGGGGDMLGFLFPVGFDMFFFFLILFL